MPASVPRRSTPTLIFSISPAPTRVRIRVPAGAVSWRGLKLLIVKGVFPMTHGFDPHSTTILAVRRNGAIALGGDGQVTLGNTVMKSNARKVRRLANGKVLAGFAGGTADAFTLFERFEGKLEKFGNLTRAAIELAKDWRSDRYLRRLEALLLVGDPGSLFVISGNGDVIEPEYDLAAIGSGGPYAQSAARALLESTELSARAIVERSMGIAADVCIYTNRNLIIEELNP